MITDFKIFEKIKTFTIKGKNVDLEIEYNKIYDVRYLRTFDLSYNELVDCGVFKYITNSQKKRAIGETYSFLYDDGHINDNKVKECIDQEVICFDDKAGPFGGKPSVTEGRTYMIYDYTDKRSRIKIKNDNEKIIYISPDRFCKTALNVNVNKYNL